MSESVIILKNVRVSFPHFFRRPVIEGTPGKFGGVFMLDPTEHAAEIQQLKKAISAVIAEKFKGQRLPSDKMCLRKGEDRGRPEYDGYYVVSANTDARPVVLNTDGSALTAEDAVIYGGCRVHASITLWAQDNKYGKRVNASLRGVKFAGDDEVLDSTYVDPDDVLNELGALGAAPAVPDDDDDFLSAA